jgi:protocatechuate 3,4-dioxygenase beta subunit
MILFAIILATQNAFPTMPSTHGRMPCGSCAPPSSISSAATIVSPSEPGQRIVISGVVYQPDSKTPAPGITLFLYQTDSSGHYNSRDNPFDPRIHGWVRTDESGHYQFETIKPGPYPNHSEPAHIHVHVFGPNRPEWFIPEYLFAGDPLISEEDRASSQQLLSFARVVSLRSAPDGKLRGRRDIRLEEPRRR